MNLLQTILAFVVVIGVLVIIHELGHYLVARWCGVKVLRFSVGMGKVIWSRRFGADQTEWAVSLLPLGGYVKMLDARDTDQGEIAPQDLQREFTRQPVGKRIAIVFAGPLANFLLAIAILAGLYVYGMPEPAARVAVAQRSLAEEAGIRQGDLVTAVNGELVGAYSELRWELVQAALQRQPVRLTLRRLGPNGAESIEEATLPLQRLTDQDLDNELFKRLGLELAQPRPLLGEIVPGGPAAFAGLQPGDLILSVDGMPVADAGAFIRSLQAAPGREVLIKGLRQGSEFLVRVTPLAERIGDKIVGRIQAQVDLSAGLVVLQAGPLEAVRRAARKTWETSTLTVTMLGKMIIGEASLKNITGPITIADYAGQSARVGWISFLTFMAFISISLGVMNLLPIPVLDGGHLLYYALELFSGRPVPERIGMFAQRAGLGVLMALMAVAVFNDIIRLIG
jgi:regulator of sigma E protease